ncbi:MAG: hypothetical protein Q4C98_05615 [Capnocytophaga sp.]|nr:hypothetical protein [Capnocytophaga sp.]
MAHRSVLSTIAKVWNFGDVKETPYLSIFFVILQNKSPAVAHRLITMKKIFILWIFLFASIAFGQEKETAADFGLNGKVKSAETIVSIKGVPQEKSVEKYVL